jgi:lysophospholipase L1-like esterase
MTDSGGMPVTGAPAATNLYQYHSGISGSVIGSDNGGRTGMTQNLTSGINFWNNGRLATVKPNLILIMLGTNDTNSNIDVAMAPSRMTTLLNSIYGLPGIGDPTIMVATIPPNRIANDRTQRVADFNAALPAVIAAQTAQGRDVYLVDHFTPLDANYAANMQSDNLHPNTAGNNVIGATWFNAIQAIAVPEPGTWIALSMFCGAGLLSFRPRLCHGD